MTRSFLQSAIGPLAPGTEVVPVSQMLIGWPGKPLHAILCCRWERCFVVVCLVCTHPGVLISESHANSPALSPGHAHPHVLGCALHVASCQSLSLLPSVVCPKSLDVVIRLHSYKLLWCIFALVMCLKFTTLCKTQVKLNTLLFMSKVWL